MLAAALSPENPSTTNADQTHAFYACLEEMESSHNKPNPYFIHNIDKNGANERWAICVRANINSPSIGMFRKNARKDIMYSEGGFKCRQCGENARNAILNFGPNGALIGKSTSDVTASSYYNPVQRLHEHANKCFDYIQLVGLRWCSLALVSDDLLQLHLRYGGLDPDTGGEYGHITGQCSSFHTACDLQNHRASMVNKGLNQLTGVMVQFIQKITNVGAPLIEVKKRVQIIYDILRTETYGNKYEHAALWFLDTIGELMNKSAILETINISSPTPNESRFHHTVMVTASMIVRSNLGEAEQKGKVVSFDLQQCNNALFNWIESSQSEEAMKRLIAATLDPAKYKQTKPIDFSEVSERLSEQHIAATEKALGRFKLAQAGLKDTSILRPSSTFLCPILRGETKQEEAKEEHGFDALRQAAKKKSKFPVWETSRSEMEREYANYRSIHQLLRLLNKLKAGERIEIFSNNFNEAGTLVKITNTDNRFWKVKPETEESSVAFSWSFLGHGTTSELYDRPWQELYGAHIISNGGNDNIILSLENAAKLAHKHKFSHSSSGDKKLSGMGTWSLSSAGERAHGRTLMTVCSTFSKLEDVDEDDFPIIGLGLCRNSQLGHEGMFHNSKALEWRISYANNDTSQYFRVHMFDDVL